MDSPRPPTGGVPVSFGRFRLLKPLGEGGMATVYLAEMQGLGGFTKKVALKLVHTHFAAQAEFARWFIGEARLGGHLDHPNIVHTLDFGEIEGRLYLAMEYVHGPSLEHVLGAVFDRKVVLPLEITLQILIQLCDGLDYAHHATDNTGQPLRMVHRDLKPSNILLSRHGVTKIADFGVARSESNVARTVAHGALKGTVRYMSPEQAWGRRDLDHRSDLFAVGSILYEMLARRYLYEGESLEVTLRRAQDADVAPRLALVPEIPHRTELLEVLGRALAADRDQRYASAGELGAALQAIEARLSQRTPLRTWLASVGPGSGEGEANISSPSKTPPASLAPIDVSLGRGDTISLQAKSGGGSAASASSPGSSSLTEGLVPASLAGATMVAQKAGSGISLPEGEWPTGSTGIPAVPAREPDGAATVVGRLDPADSSALADVAGISSLTPAPGNERASASSGPGEVEIVSFFSQDMIPAGLPRGAAPQDDAEPGGRRPSRSGPVSLPPAAGERRPVDPTPLPSSRATTPTMFEPLEARTTEPRLKALSQAGPVADPAGPDAAGTDLEPDRAPAPAGLPLLKIGIGIALLALVGGGALLLTRSPDPAKTAVATPAPTTADPGRTTAQPTPASAPPSTRETTGPEPTAAPATPSTAGATQVSSTPAPQGRATATDPAGKSDRETAADPTSRPTPTPRGQESRPPAQSRPPQARGSLFLNSRPPSTILVDGKETGRFPVLGMSVKAGPHTVSFVSPEGKRIVQKVGVGAGGTVRCMAWFDQNRAQCEAEGGGSGRRE